MIVRVLLSDGTMHTYRGTLQGVIDAIQTDGIIRVEGEWGGPGPYVNARHIVRFFEKPNVPMIQ